MKLRRASESDAFFLFENKEKRILRNAKENDTFII